MLATTAVILVGCSKSNNGELVGVNDRPYFEDIDLKGMVFVNQGNYTMGAGSQNMTYGQQTITQPRKMQISSIPPSWIPSNRPSICRRRSFGRCRRRSIPTFCITAISFCIA